MKKVSSIILKGSAKEISIDKAFADAINNAPPPSGHIPQVFTLIEFYVEKGGIVGIPMSHVMVKCKNIND
jgi:hypothetical protein